ncbi:unnamed protein product [Discosporangium mesarthrocarpum]
MHRGEGMSTGEGVIAGGQRLHSAPVGLEDEDGDLREAIRRSLQEGSSDGGPGLGAGGIGYGSYGTSTRSSSRQNEAVAPSAAPASETLDGSGGREGVRVEPSAPPANQVLGEAWAGPGAEAGSVGGRARWGYDEELRRRRLLRFGRGQEGT